MDTTRIRNFCILAHIDHGKSTLADRFLELTGAVEKRKMREQYLDMHPLEREKGITIKMQPVRMRYTTGASDHVYELNLIDTPGHADFSYEVSRALAAVEGAILLVDAAQGVQAQTIANFRLAEKEDLVIIPVINKIDLPSAKIEKTKQELCDLLNIQPEDIFKVSAKTGEGIEYLLNAVIKKVPAPRVEASEQAPLRALIFDSVYDPYQGVIAHVRVFEGAISSGEEILFLTVDKKAEVSEVGVFLPERAPQKQLSAGEIGYIATGMKEPEFVRVGDTITKLKFFINQRERITPLPGYRDPAPMVFASVFPEDQNDYEALRDSLKKLKLNDAALVFEAETAVLAQGRGFRVGFLGMLHREIVSERLRREYGLSLIFSNPSVAFRVVTKSGAVRVISSAVTLPPRQEIAGIEEPWVRAEIIAPSLLFGAVSSLIHERGGSVAEITSLAGERLRVCATMPLREIIVNFHEALKQISQGFASLSYVLDDYRPGDLVRLDIRVAGEPVPSFADILPRERAFYLGRARVEKLKELLPRALFSIALQAETDGRIIARETIPAMRKDVTGYLYGGDRTRKMKLWKKQQQGKKRLKEEARVEISADVFLKMFRE